MSSPEVLLHRIGNWIGPSRLWLPPQKVPRESNSQAAIAFAAKRNFIRIAYTWSFDGDPQDGLLLLSQDQASNAVEAFWIDSWHMSDKFMICHGDVNEQGVISVKGSYAAPPGPDWGWRIVIDPGSPEFLVLQMYNITPEGQEELAVEAQYARDLR